MIDKIIILIFFAGFLFLPLFIDFSNDHHSKNYFKMPRNPLHSIDNSNSIVDAISSVSNSVVGISVSRINQDSPAFEFKNGIFVPYDSKKNIKTLGSGLIYSNNGYVITNTHVIKDASDIYVTLTGGQKYKASLVGYDILTDIALLKVEANNLPASILGDNSNLNIGDWVIALGNPLGLFDISYQPSATIGIISGLNIDFGIKENNYVYKDMIQTDASINEGNSGGPLINIDGEVIGINTFIMTGSNVKKGSIGIAFSIPINRVMDIVHELILNGEIKRSYNTGITIKPINANVINYFNYPFNEGAVVVDVEKQSSAEKSDIKVGDIIFKVDDIVVNSYQDFINVNNENLRKSGDNISIEIWRENNFLIKSLELQSFE